VTVDPTTLVPGTVVRSGSLVYVDTETISLDAAPDVIWEVGLVKEDGTECHWFLPVDLGRADTYALKVGGFHDRHPHGYHTPHDLVDDDGPHVTNRRTFAYDFARLTAGCILVGAVPSFDEARLRLLLRANGACPDWSHRVRCVETLTAGHLRREVGGLKDCARALGVPVDIDSLHTALGDARLARDIWQKVMGS
jgi:DNA polymerase III epsilon subunit-like protein